MASWNREGEVPRTQRVIITIDSESHPELARFVWGLPFRAGSKTLRDMLIKALRESVPHDPLQELSAHFERAQELLAQLRAADPASAAAAQAEAAGEGNNSPAAPAQKPAAATAAERSFANLF
jgi:hypothetical protein